METKALKKQLGAAIAMVLVAAVALGSATYAWFVSNNTVEATTSTISAQSNSAYLVIDKVTTSTDSTSSVTISGDNKPLYPATIDKVDGAATWYSAYASAVDASTMKASSKFIIGKKGTAAEAQAEDYAITETFYIGTGTYDGEFTDLKVTGVAVANGATSELSSAMRVLVVCGTNWQVWSADGEQLYSGDDAGAALKGSVSKGNDAAVDVYVYYDGDDTNVFSNNLTDIDEDNALGLTITFSATPKEYGKTA